MLARNHAIPARLVAVPARALMSARQQRPWNPLEPPWAAANTGAALARKQSSGPRRRPRRAAMGVGSGFAVGWLLFSPLARRVPGWPGLAWFGMTFGVGHR